MVIDIFKALAAAKLAKWLFPKLAAAAMLAGFGAIVGHVFPFYMNFRGGKGLAAFGGMVLAFDGWVFLFLLVTGILLMLVFNASVAMPMYAAAVFPFIALWKTRNLGIFLVSAAASVLIVVKHWSNIDKARRGEDLDIRRFVKNLFVKEGANS